MKTESKIVLLKHSDDTIACVLQVKNYNDKFASALNTAMETYQNSNEPMDTVLVNALQTAGYLAEIIDTAEFTIPYPKPTPSDPKVRWDTHLIRSIGWTSSEKHPDPGVDTVLMRVTLHDSVDPNAPAFRDKTLVYKNLLYGRVRTCPGPDDIISMNVTSDTDRDGDNRLTYDIAYKMGKPHGRSIGAEPTPFGTD